MVSGVTAIIPATWEAEAGSRWRPVWATESDSSQNNNKIFKGTKVGSEFNPQYYTTTTITPSPKKVMHPLFISTTSLLPSDHQHCVWISLCSPEWLWTEIILTTRVQLCASMPGLCLFLKSLGMLGVLVRVAVTNSLFLCVQLSGALLWWFLSSETIGLSYVVTIFSFNWLWSLSYPFSIQG